MAYQVFKHTSTHTYETLDGNFASETKHKTTYDVMDENALALNDTRMGVECETVEKAEQLAALLNRDKNNKQYQLITLKSMAYVDFCEVGKVKSHYDDGGYKYMCDYNHDSPESRALYLSYLTDKGYWEDVVANLQKYFKEKGF